MRAPEIGRARFQRLKHGHRQHCSEVLTDLCDQLQPSDGVMHVPCLGGKLQEHHRDTVAKVQAADGQMTLPIHPFAQSAAEHGSQSRIRDTEQQLVHSPLAQGGLVKARAAHG